MMIRINCTSGKLRDISALEDFQGHLKSIKPSELTKLKNSIKRYGFSFPIFVWGDRILDGHQRIAAVKSLIEDGWKLIYNKLPIVEINAKNSTEAAEKLLIINSRYAEIEQDGFDAFVERYGIDLEDIESLIKLDEVKLFDNSDIDDEYEEIIKEGLEYKISIDCDSEGHQVQLIQKLEEMGLKCRPLIL